MFNNLKKVFLYYSVIFLISSLILFTAYNWQKIGNIGKISIPLLLTIISSLFGICLKKELYKNLSYLFSSFSIGATFATIGQVYQTGADSWKFFILWSIFLIIPMLVSKFYAIVMLFTTTLYTGFLFFLDHEMNINIYYSTFLLGIIVIVYPLLTKKIKFNEIYYYTVFIVYILLNRGYRLLEFEEEGTLIQDFLALAILFGIYIIGYIKEKRLYVYPLALIDLALILITLIDKIFNFEYSSYIFWLLSLVLFIIILYKIICFSLKEEIKRTGKILKISYIVGFIKVMIILFAIGLVESIFFVFKLEKEGLILISLGSFLFSWFSYKILKNNEKKCEIISLAIGLMTLTFYLLEVQNFSLLRSSLILIIIFNLFYYFRYTQILDYFFIGVHTSVVILIVDKFIKANTGDLKSYLMELTLYIVCFSVIALSIIFKNKIELSKNKKRIIRMLRGNEIYLICVVLISYKDSIFYKLPYSILYVVLAMLIILKKSFNPRLKISILPAILVGVIGCTCLKIPEVSFGFLLFLIYNFRKEKIAIWVVFFITTRALIMYYYSLDISLLDKSILLLEASVISFVTFLLWKYYLRGEIVEK